MRVNNRSSPIMSRAILVLLIALISLFSGVNCTSQYKVTQATQTNSSITLLLSYTGSSTYYLKPTSPIIQSLNFTIVVKS